MNAPRLRWTVGVLVSVMSLAGCDCTGQIGENDAGGGDAGLADAGDVDAGQSDAGNIDAGQPDAGDVDAGQPDAGDVDAGQTDAGDVDAGQTDAGDTDAGQTDAGDADAGQADAGDVDAGPADAGDVDAGPPDAGPPDAGPPDSGVTLPSIIIDDVTHAEGNSGTTSYTFTVTLDRAPVPGLDVQLSWATQNGTATAGSDYAAGSGTLTFTSTGALTATITVQVNGDLVLEPDETFLVTLSNPINATLSRAQGTGTIVNDDTPLASITDARVKEGDFGKNELVFVVSLDVTPPVGADVQLSWVTADGTATAGSDYLASSGALTFTNGGPLAKRITVPILGDTVPEPNEQFTVTLTPVANVGLQKGVGAGTIVNDDLPSLTINNVTLPEGGSATTTPFVFTVTLSSTPQPSQDVTVAWATASLSAFSPADFTAGSGTLTFTSGGPTTQTITVNVAGNATKEFQKEFLVNLTNPTNATLADPIGVGTIVDDDGAIIRVDGTATGTADGLTWATAYPSVQAGVDRAFALGGGQVWVAAGTYTNGGGTGPVLTVKQMVSVIGGFDGWRGGAGAQETQLSARDFNAHVTRLDGAATAYHVVLGTAVAVLDGLTIANGNANAAGTSDTDPNRRGGGIDITVYGLRLANCVLTGNYAAGNGGGIYATSNFVAHDTRFIGNSANSGGAIYTSVYITLFDDLIQGNLAGQFTLGGGYGGGVEDNSQSSSTTYTNVTFDTNHGSYGGGLHLSRGASIVRRCTFLNNLAQGPLGASGGGLYDDSWSASKVYDSVFVGNRAGDGGGGMDLRDSNTLVSNCRFENNTANYGAGVFNWNVFGGTQQIINSRFAYNRASSYGGGAHNQQSSPVFASCVFEGNEGGTKGGAMYNFGGSPTIINSLLLNDTATSGPELQNDPLGSAPVIPSNPIAINTIISNHSFVALAVAGTGGTLTATYSVNSDASGNPGFNHVPLRSHRIGGGSTVSSLNFTNANTNFAVNDVIEVANDGVARTVTAVTATAITITPALGAVPALSLHVDNWGPGATDLMVDLRLRSDSVCIDAGNNSAVPADLGDLNHNGNVAEQLPLDFWGNARFDDDPSWPNTGLGTSPLVDIGPTERPAP